MPPARWPRVIARPGLPQIRTCRITASGSSGRNFAPWTAYGMDGDAVRQAVPLPKPVEPVPRRPMLAVAACQPFAPDALNGLTKSIQGERVARDSVIGVVSTHLLTQYGVLLRNRKVPVGPTPPSNRPGCSAETALGRFAFHHPVALLRTRPEVREAKQVECTGPVTIRTASWASGVRRLTKVNQFGLLGVDRQAVFLKTFWKYRQDPTSVALMGKPNDRIVGITDQKRGWPRSFSASGPPPQLTVPENGRGGFATRGREPCHHQDVPTSLPPFLEASTRSALPSRPASLGVAKKRGEILGPLCQNTASPRASLPRSLKICILIPTAPRLVPVTQPFLAEFTPPVSQKGENSRGRFSESSESSPAISNYLHIHLP